MPVGAELVNGGVHFRVWAPDCTSVDVEFENDSLPLLSLQSEPSGYFSALAPGATAGMLYWMRLNGGAARLPDPASRWQPRGPRGPSQIVDPHGFAWTDQAWRGRSFDAQVLYEMHVGTFTAAGTWNAASRQLAALAELGVTTIELLPVHDFPGRFGWGYDVANLFAPTRLYGTPEEFRRFVDTAHGLGLGVILDVVYNHLGGVGEELLRPFAGAYVSRRYKNEWGAAVNFDDEHSASVREFFLTNVRYWIEEFHLDGFRVDATQAFFDETQPHILLEICRTARESAPGRNLLLVGENEPQRARLLRPATAGGYEYDALWNDDFHHAAVVRLTGRSEAYNTDYRGSAEEFLAASRWGYLYQGQRYSWQQNPRGTPALDIAAPRFVNYLQNHDQVANSADGARLHSLTSPGRYRAMTALFLLAPQTPLLFQGQEFAASSPFLYFNDCQPDDRDEVRGGRAEFLKQFRSLATDAMQQRLADPCDHMSFLRSKLDHDERERHAWAYALHRDLLRLRRDDPVIGLHDARDLHGGTLSPDAFFLRWLPPTGQTRLLVVNFDRDLRLDSIAHPLVAPPEAARWSILWSSEDPAYGGHGTPELDTPAGWRIPGESAVLLHPVPRSESP